MMSVTSDKLQEKNQTELCIKGSVDFIILLIDFLRRKQVYVF